MSQPADRFDVAVLGAGPGGCAAAMQAARRGARTCLIERDLLGGVCLNAGCIPTKAMLAGSKQAWRMAHPGPFGIDAAIPSIDGRAFMRRVRHVVRELRSAEERRLRSQRNLEIIYGAGCFTAPDALLVRRDGSRRVLQAERIIIATGARPIVPSFAPPDSPKVMTYSKALNMDDLPPSVLIIGGGVLGCELATIYSELGVKTTLLEQMERLLPDFDPEASQAAARSLALRGVEVSTGGVVEVRSEKDGATAVLSEGRSISAHCALLAVGRQANTDEIALEAAGVKTAEGIIPVDQRCRTNVPHIFAVGDVAEKRQYAHLAERMGFIAAENATGHDAADDRRIVPLGVYTHPQIGSVGLNEQQARRRFGSLRVLRHRYRHSAMAVAGDETEGLVKLLVEKETGQPLGALWIGPAATDMIHEVALAMRNGLSLEQIGQTIHAHPTFQEALQAAVEPWIVEKRRSRG